VPAIATAGDEVEVTATVDPSQPFGHREILFIPPFAPQQKLRKEWGTLITEELGCNGEAWATRPVCNGEAWATRPEPMHVASTRKQTPMHHDRHGLTSAYLVFADSRRNLVEITPEACRLLGYERAELLRMTVDQITAKSDAPVPELFSKFVAEGFQEGSYTLKHRSGRQIPIRYRAKVFPDGCMAAEWFPFISAQKQQAKRRA